MNSFRNLSLGSKLGLAFGLLFVLQLVTGSAGWYAKQRIGDVVDYLTGPAWSAADGAMETQINIEAQVIQVLRMGLPDADQAGLRASLAKTTRDSGESMARVTSSELLPKAEIERLRRDYDALQRSQEALLTALAGQDTHPEALAAAEHAYAEQAGVVLETLTKVEELGDATFESQAKLVAELESQVNTVLSGALALGIAMTLLLTWVSMKAVATPVARVAQELRQIASSSGSLKVRLPVESEDEVGQLASAFNAFMAKLQGTLDAIGELSNNLASASNQLSAATNSVSSSISRQQEETDQIATAINELAASAQSIASTTSTANAASDRSQSRAQEGRSVIGSVMSSIGGLAQDVQGATTAILDLERNSNDIGRVLEVIRAIAEQTNLLALNAAIEAARAGDQGRGFAVVADEVRTLAQRTGESTEEIHQMIDGLQNAIRRVSSTMELSRQQAISTAETAHHAESALEAIGSAVDESRRLNSEIAGATDEQQNVTSSVHHTVLKIHQHMIDNAAAAEESSRTADHLRDLAQRLNSALSQFRTS